MPTPSSRYQPGAAPDYTHRFHAGNVGDVWKHCALVEVLRRTGMSASRVRYLDTHAGDGSYPLGPTGEWSHGIGRLWSGVDDAMGDDAVFRYLALCRRLGAGTDRPERYPGSPVFARAVLGPSAELVLWERDETAFAQLSSLLHDDPQARLVGDDGLAKLGDEIGAAESGGDAVVVLVDPSWAQKTDWTLIPEALVRAVAVSRRTCLVLWYPVKSLTRPNAMIARFEAAGIAGTIAELITTPLQHKRNRLNGSGVLLVRPPAGVVESLAAAAPVIGQRCATHAGFWSLRVQSWSRGAAPD